MKRLKLVACLLLVPLLLGACAPRTAASVQIPITARPIIPNAITVAAQANLQGRRLATLIIYPGARVRAEAYRWLGEALSPFGIQTVIVRFPLDLALLSPNRADDVLAGLPVGEQVYLAGHSLGGVSAARYARDHANPNQQKRITGLILMGSYPADDVSLRDSPVKVLDLLAELDGLSTPAKVEAGLSRLPASTRLVRLPGAVHAYFGRYGPQKGDGTPTASREATEALIVQSVRAFMLGE